MNLRIIKGDCRETLAQVAAGAVQCCVTSPPYFGLRSYLPKEHPAKAREIGQEKTPQDYVAALLAVFGGKDNPVGVWRALKADGTLWLNLGDSYAASGKQRTPAQAVAKSTLRGKTDCQASILHQQSKIVGGLKPKDLIGIPWRVAFALQAAGWYLRSDIVWAKPNCMPESVTDRCTRSHEYIFLLSKAPRYYYDHVAIKEPPSPDLVKQVEEGYNGTALKDYLRMGVQDASATKGRIISGLRKRIDKQRGHGRRHNGFNDKWDALNPQEQALLGANKRDVWRHDADRICLAWLKENHPEVLAAFLRDGSNRKDVFDVAPACYAEAHFATFPPELIKPCILAGSRAGDVVLDPFGGSGTTAQVALELGRQAIVCELNDDYVPLIEQRTRITPGLALV